MVTQLSFADVHRERDYARTTELSFDAPRHYDEQYLVAKKAEQFLRDHVEGIYVSHSR